MELLASTQPAELPKEALLVRLRSRRSRFQQSDGESLATDPEEIFDWVYRRLDRKLRTQLAPFLELMAMRSLILSLRYVLNNEPIPQTLLRHALLAKSLQKLLAATVDSKTLVPRLETALVNDYPFVAGLAESFQSQGPGGLEQQLAKGILLHALERSERGIIRVTICYLIDMRNLLTIRKFWSWQVAQKPPLTTGGTITAEQLHRIWSSFDDARLIALAAKVAGKTGQFEKAVHMEQSLINGLSRILRRASREPLSCAVIVDYLWHGQIALHNRLLKRIMPAERHELLQEVLLP